MNKKEEKLQSQLEQLDALQSPCINCGLCLEGCPTYQTSGWEHESPRGRIRLARDLMQGKIHPNSPSLETFDQCAACNLCEPLCPAAVQYGKLQGIVQTIRSDWSEIDQKQSLVKTYRVHLASFMQKIRRYFSH